ncbi:P-loop containing nucleoside triphosphate hydrolase protein [Kalaharituber pfeilii]|nr:P-loop containing nucleoside triphosphate hydrolase protein [Kalaharituber pfeilii]
MLKLLVPSHTASTLLLIFRNTFHVRYTCTLTPPLASFSAKKFRSSRPLLQQRWYSAAGIRKSTTTSQEALEDPIPYSVPEHHKEYTERRFTDLVTLNLQSGSGGHGCISFLREKFIARGPPNGGDGGRGGSVYIQAVYGETNSLHKIGRQGVVKAGDGKNGKGKSKNGERGEDVIIRVPVGTVVRELERWDPNEVLEEELAEFQEEALNLEEEGIESPEYHGSNDRWIHYPRSEADNLASPKFQAAKYPTQHHLSATQILKYTHPLPVHLDLSKPTSTPILLLPGAPGGFGNPHFITQKARAPKYATRGGKGCSMRISLELKILADVGLVGLPNAGKSSFLRAVSRRKAKVGEWEFTTLTPNLGTVVLDPLKSPLRPKEDGDPRESFTIADIPGLIADAHLNKGLGHGFLRHVERAKVLAIVIDLGRDDPLDDLNALWKEMKAYEEGWGDEKVMASVGRRLGMIGEMSGNRSLDPDLPLTEEEASAMEQKRDGQDDWPADYEPPVEGNGEELVHWPGSKAVLPKQAASPHSFTETPIYSHELMPSKREKITLKPWFVIANKADLPGTEGRFLELMNYVKELEHVHNRQFAVVPVSAMRGEGVEAAVEVMKGLLDNM